MNIFAPMRNTLTGLPGKLRERLNRLMFIRELQAIHQTPALKLGTQPFTLLSMVHHRDVACYLLAAKSFARFLNPRRVVVVADPSITDEDRQTIARHIPSVELVRCEDSRDPALPQGGCWERLIAIADRVRDDYVIQLDADTVTIADIPEIHESVSARRSFVLGTIDDQEMVTYQVASDFAKRYVGGQDHVQIQAEIELANWPDQAAGRYVRGCAGFSGFAPGSFSREDLRRLSVHMSKALGRKWNDWGSEQFASNFMVGRCAQAIVLPHPKYCHPGRERPGAAFLHFIGYVRFVTDRYTRAAREACSALTT